MQGPIALTRVNDDILSDHFLKLVSLGKSNNFQVPNVEVIKMFLILLTFLGIDGLCLTPEDQKNSLQRII